MRDSFFPCLLQQDFRKIYKAPQTNDVLILKALSWRRVTAIAIKLHLSMNSLHLSVEEGTHTVVLDFVQIVHCTFYIL